MTKRPLAAWLRTKLVVPSSGQHWDFLDGLRGLAILMVVFCHTFHYTSPNLRFAGWPRLTHAFIGAGHLGVQMFFVLSGFLISQPFFAAKLKNPQVWYLEGYTMRRFLKIIPPYYLTIVLLLIYYGYQGEVQQIKFGLLWLLGIPDFISIPGAFGFNGAFWSLWVEVGFYIVLPLFFLLSRNRGYWQTGMTMALVLLIVPFLTRTLIPVDSADSLFQTARFPNGLTNFGWGILFACLYAKAKQTGRSLKKYAPLGYLGLLLLLLAMFLDAQFFILNRTMTFEIPLYLCGFSTFLTLFFIFDSSILGARFFSMSFIRYFGLIGYEWFLVHLPFVEGFRNWMGRSTSGLWRYFSIGAISIILTFTIAALIYQYYSTPIIKWGRRRLERTKITA